LEFGNAIWNTLLSTTKGTSLRVLETPGVMDERQAGILGSGLYNNHMVFEWVGPQSDS
jgi:hypothetical protein